MLEWGKFKNHVMSDGCKFLIRKLYSWIDNVAVHEH